MKSDRTDPNAIPQDINVLSPIDRYYYGATESTPSLSETVFKNYGLGSTRRISSWK